MISLTTVLGVLVVVLALGVIGALHAAVEAARQLQAAETQIAMWRERTANQVLAITDLQKRLEKAERTAGLVVDQLAADAGLLREPTFARNPSAAGPSGALPKLMAGLGLNTIHRDPGPQEGGRAADQ